MLYNAINVITLICNALNIIDLKIEGNQKRQLDLIF